jgi:nitroimidazol reductase NimA-like FMN-containing flavoprotein (pyridoxamine 5'-phosphate oxidase superfamily)
MQAQKEDLEGLITNLLNSQRLAVLSTSNANEPYSNLICFAPDDDLNSILFATTRSTRKYDNLSRESSVSILIDNRLNEPSDVYRVTSLTALGTATEIVENERDAAVSIYLKKHPHLRDFVNSPTCAFFRVRVKRYIIVTHFQNVRELYLSP